MKTNIFFIFLMCSAAFLHAQKTYVPDDGFEYYLETHTASGGSVNIGDANSMGDGVMNDSVPTAKIQNVSALDIHGLQIADLTGIEDFTSLQTLDCHDNALTSMDITHNTALQWLSCADNQLTQLDVGRNDQLRWLYCSNNQLTQLDVTINTLLQQLTCHHNQLNSLNIRYNTDLRLLDCGFNQLTSLNVSQNTQLEHLACNNNSLTSLDLSQNTALNWLSCSNNQLSALDLTNNTALESLYCTNNQLTDLDLRPNTLLENLICNDNQIQFLDLTRNTALTEINCASNQLTFMDVRNGHNTQITSFNARNNPDLTCIYVDDATWSQQHWTEIDSHTHFVETQAECDAVNVAQISDKGINLYPNPASGIINVEVKENMHFVLTNPEGRVLQQGQLQEEINLLDISYLPSGIYLISLINEKGNTKMYKVIKQ